jgi:multiple sugar transport system permease protein
MLPALLVLALVTIGPALYLVITSLTPLTPVNPDTAFDFSDPAGN